MSSGSYMPPPVRTVSIPKKSGGERVLGVPSVSDNIDFELLMKAVRWHTKERWLLLYVERWLKTPFSEDDGTLVERTKGTPPGRSRKSGPG